MTATMHYQKDQLAKQNGQLPLSEHVAEVLAVYFNNLDGELPEELYSMVMHEVERPLLEMLMNYVHNNQSKAAQALGINRGTFRKKLAFYGML